MLHRGLRAITSNAVADLHVEQGMSSMYALTAGASRPHVGFKKWNGSAPRNK
jgi:hypothetical protein